MKVPHQIVALIPLVTFSAAIGAEHPERWYQEKAAEKLGGKMEVRVPDGRVDIVTDEYAIEVEFASKWKNAIGQALWYAMQTNKKAGIVVIIKNAKDAGDAIRLESVIEHNRLPIRVWRWGEDI
ncbi:hypothetical protein [Haloferula sargassicola]|uniref:Uncharacterized protein n=1 Tax=Haloferula sargassicola TaxID=490096 RepID=A0ABP9UN23_9BACT